jgi:hypothetical protein
VVLVRDDPPVIHLGQADGQPQPVPGVAIEVRWRAAPQQGEGERDVRAFLLGGPLQSRWRFLPTTANGQLAFGTYLRDEVAGHCMPGGLDVLTIRSGHVAEVTAFLTADLTRFRLPARIRP